MSFISIVIATHNGSEYISEQLHSILDQTYRDFEIIVIDDCSHDSTVEIIKEIFTERKFLNYSIEVNSSNIGVTKTFEKGIGKSKGKYIAISDQDDIWLQDKLEKSLNALEKYSADIVHSPSLILKGSNEKPSSIIYPEHRNFKNLFALLMHNNARGATLFMKRDFVTKLIPFSKYDLYDKWIYFLGILYGKVYYFDKPLHYYRIHKENYIGDKYKFRRKKDLILKLNSEMLFYKQLFEYVSRNKDVKYCYSYNEILNEIENIIKFINDISICINNKNLMECFWKYLQNIFGRGFNKAEKITYLYYYLFKLR